MMNTRDTFLTAQEIHAGVRFNRIALYLPDDTTGVHDIAPAIGWWVGWSYTAYPPGWKDVERHLLSGWRPSRTSTSPRFSTCAYCARKTPDGITCCGMEECLLAWQKGALSCRAKE